ncbi:hypothetical protein dsmv_1976 [Desulfococcus multivorans DSM 2059]|uniref:Uncharacterized protein n=1 Tax=Desulfococcus multivorans DSM 2059 TaxID=1121405 RepID=S7VAK2_DESML|nr:hypothetical protein dsmv_1976 [Desulfococcus multivorans DSM 2059]
METIMLMMLVAMTGLLFRESPIPRRVRVMLKRR